MYIVYRDLYKNNKFFIMIPIRLIPYVIDMIRNSRSLLVSEMYVKLAPAIRTEVALCKPAFSR